MVFVYRAAAFKKGRERSGFDLRRRFQGAQT
jgi:hypothetical protein